MDAIFLHSAPMPAKGKALTSGVKEGWSGTDTALACGVTEEGHITPSNAVTLEH